MNDFNENFDNVEDNNLVEPEQNVEESENSQTQNQDFNFNGEEKLQDTPVWNKVNFSEDAPYTDYRPMNKGLRVFALVLAAVVVLAASCTTGYFLGRKSVSNGYIGAEVELDLESKPSDSDSMSPAQVYQKVNKSIVGIRVYNETGAASDASGVIYSEDGYIVTNDHIYSEVGAPKFKVFMHDGSEYDAVYVAGDSVSDLAVLKIENVKGLDTATFGNSNEIVCGENVVAIGRPSDATDSSSITTGIISLTKRRVKTTSSYTARLIQTDSAINPGSSGGALVNMHGQVIGITSAKLAGVVYEGIGYAIPTTTMKRVVEQLISEGKVIDRAKLGITYTEVNSVTAEINNHDSVGLYIVSVGEESDIFGKVAEGDMITHVNGIKITNDDIILDVIEDSKAGDKITLTVMAKNGAQTDYTVTLRANVGESSYSQNITIPESPNDSSSEQEGSNTPGGTFDFPFGD